MVKIYWITWQCYIGLKQVKVIGLLGICLSNDMSFEGNVFQGICLPRDMSFKEYVCQGIGLSMDVLSKGSKSVNCSINS